MGEREGVGKEKGEWPKYVVETERYPGDYVPGSKAGPPSRPFTSILEYFTWAGHMVAHELLLSAACARVAREGRLPAEAPRVGQQRAARDFFFFLVCFTPAKGMIA